LFFNYYNLVQMGFL